MKALLKNRDRQFWTAVYSAAVLFALVAAEAAWASSGGEEGGHVSIKTLLWPVVNFVILVAILYKLAWQKMKNFFAGRRDGIKTALEEAVAAKEEAEKKFKEYSDRLAKATDEIAGISDMIKAQGQVEKDKIIESAKVTAAKMKEDAQARMEQELKTASNRLRAEAAELSVKMAEDVLKKTVKEKDHETMVKDFLNRMVKQN